MTGTNFYYGDLYPGMSAMETGNETTPDPEELQALHEKTSSAEESSISHARSKNVWIAALIFVAIIIFFGGN